MSSTKPIRRSVFLIRPDTHPGSARLRKRDVDNVVDTIDACSFPWWKAIKQMAWGRRFDRFPFPIDWKKKEDIEGNILGYVSSRHMWLRENVGVDTISHEIGHVADLSCLGESRGAPHWNTTNSPLRDELQELATHNDNNQDHPHSWRGVGFGGATWEERAIEAVTVPFTRAFFEDRKFHYPEWRFTSNGHTWDDVSAVKEIFLRGGSMPFNDESLGTHEDDILWMAEHGLAEGDADGYFNPNENVTRGQMAAFISRYHRELHGS